MGKNIQNEIKKAMNPVNIGNMVGEVMNQTSGLTPQFMEKVSKNQVYMQENQVEFGKYLKLIVKNQKTIIALLKEIKK